MKPAPFEYYAPTTLDEAVSLLAESGGEAKVLAGGQSLLPAMNFRLARPLELIDLNRIDDLFGITAAADGGLRIRAMTRQRAVECSSLVATRAPLLAEAMPHIAHPQIRNRGTFGGSLAHADPAAELPALAVALNASLLAQGRAGERRIPAAEFYLGVFTTALEPDELLVEVNIPPLPTGSGTAFIEAARRHGDYALAGACAVVTLEDDGTFADGRLVLFAVGDGPIDIRTVPAALRGTRLDPDDIRAAVELLDAEIDPPTDIHASTAYRRHLASGLACRVLQVAAERARARLAL